MNNFEAFAIDWIVPLILVSLGVWLLWKGHRPATILQIDGGGKGGNAKVIGRNSGAEDGSGGRGQGGTGGYAEVTGDNSFARGGDGGNSDTIVHIGYGGGGRATKSPCEVLGKQTLLWKYRRGVGLGCIRFFRYSVVNPNSNPNNR